MVNSLSRIRKSALTIFLCLLILPIIHPNRSDAQISDKLKYEKEVKEEFLHSWNNYKKYAWGHDELKPLSKTYHDWYKESLLMTPVDGYDTMVLMGLKAEADEAKELILTKLSFDKDMEIQAFEITIRELGGLLSAYELSRDKRFLNLAAYLGNRLLPIFNSPTGMPYRYVNLKTGATRDSISNPAEIGSLTLEFGTLSRLTGNPIYFAKAKKAVTALFNRRSSIGLVGTWINVNTGKWTDRDSHISGAIDSYYEYLLKASLLFNDQDFKKMWDESVQAVNKYLADTVDGELWYGHADMDTGVVRGKFFGALDAFFPAELALGGDLKRAEKLENSCYKMWLYYGIEPEEINYTTMSIDYPQYYLRPENIESNYYLYKFTRQKEYLSRAETYFNTLVYNCRVENGYASLNDVRTKEKIDEMPSYFLAETLKYLYLTFAPDSVFDFNGHIFNTEAHPLQKNFK